ncbi:MAG: hypothetical protein Q8K55_00095 [Gemmatimonadaceae bacterium]|nr:hypothetical protein [Gemmatimonadaceae bacterium]
MIKPRAWLALAAMALAPVALQAQTFGAAFGGWMTTDAGPENNPARGIRLSGSYDRPFRTAARWRLEAAFVQAGFTRDFPTRPNRHVTENSLELATLLMSASAGWAPVRAFIGPVLSVGIGCGTDGENDSDGRVACDGDGGDETVSVGAAIGLHAALGSVRQFTLELQGQGNTIAAARGKGPVILLSAGLRVPR